MAPKAAAIAAGVVAAAAAGAAGYYAWTRYAQVVAGKSDAGGGSPAASGGAAGGSRPPPPADAAGRLEQSRRLLAAEWEGVNRDEARGFGTWWGIAEGASKLKLLQGARELFQARLAESGAGPLLLQLCPELGDSGLGRMAEAEGGGATVPALIEIRIHQVEACTRHDRAFVQANIGEGVEAAKVEATVYNRQLLMLIYLTDVIVLFKHMSREGGGGA